MAEETTTTGSTETAGASTTTTGTSPANGGNTAADEKKFTQADLDRIAGERAERGKKAGISELLESLGMKSPDELKKLLEAQRKAEEDKLSEVEKAKKAAEKLQQERETLAAELQQERDARKQEKLDAAIVAAAKGAHDSKDVVRILRSDYSERLSKAMKEDGTIEQKVLDDLIADVKKSKAYLFGAGGGAGSPSNHGGKTPEPDAKAKEAARTNMRRDMQRKF